MAEDWVVWDRHVLDPGSGTGMDPASWTPVGHRSGRENGAVAKRVRRLVGDRRGSVLHGNGACKWGGIFWRPAEGINF